VPGIAQDSRGHIYVFNRSPHPLLEFDPSGRFVREIGEGMFVSAHSVRIDSEDNIWAVDVNAHFVVRFNPQGRVTMVLGYKNRGSEEPEYFNRPTDIAFARNGDFYITDGYVNSRVVKYSKDGKLLKIWGKKGTGPGEFNLPHAVVVDAKGRVYVADRENKRIQIFDSDGNFIREWKQFGSPWGLEITPDQHIFMADGYADRVVELDTEGKQLGTLGSSGKAPGQFFYAHGICAGKDGALYVSEIRNWRVQKFVRR
jgi:DNA-binding beta-propeller fold protein YncE